MSVERRKKNNSWIKWVAMTVVIALVGFGAYYIGGIGNPRADTTGNMGAVQTNANETQRSIGGNYANVTRGSLTSTVYGEGSLAPTSKKELYTEVEGKVQSVEVEIGDTVQQGDVLMRLSSDDLESQVSELQANLFGKQVELAGVRDKGNDTYIYAPSAGRLKIVDVEKGDDVAVAMKTKSKLAVISRDDKLRVEFEPSSSTEALKVGDAVTVWIDNKGVTGYVEQLSGLAGNIAVTVDDDKYELGKEALVSTLQGEKLGVGLLEINMPVPVTGIGGNIKSVYYDEEDTVASGAKLFYLDGRIPSAELQQALLYYNNARTDLDNALEKQENLLVRAPISGVITRVAAGEGQQLETSTNAFSIQSSDTFRLNADVDELDIVGVSVGQRADVTLDAYPGKLYQGTVSKISGIAKVAGGVATYTVTLEMDASMELRDGMTASMQIVAAEKSGILIVPSDAINSANGQNYVVTSDGRTVYVETGISNQDYVEIVAGLNEGEQVQTRERAEPANGQGFPPMGGGSGFPRG